MNKKARVIGVLWIILGIGFFMYRVLFVVDILPNGILVDALGYIVAAYLSIFIGIMILVCAKIASIVNIKKSQGSDPM